MKHMEKQGKQEKSGSLIGALIRKERLKQNYSQEGLCKGICVVSYLSKIENGQVDASLEIISALLQRLGIQYEADPVFLEHAGSLIRRLYEKAYDYTLQEQDLEELQRERQRYLSSEYMLDAMLLLRGCQGIYYNIASTSLEWNQIDRAEAYFQKCARKDAFYYHKYAICKERLGKKEEALEMLQRGRESEGFGEASAPSEMPGMQNSEQASFVPNSVLKEMYGVVEYRLRYEGYQKDPEYERILRRCMEHIGECLPKSYQKFHVPFLIEVLEQQRKYKEICELMREFAV